MKDSRDNRCRLTVACALATAVALAGCQAGEDPAPTPSDVADADAVFDGSTEADIDALDDGRDARDSDALRPDPTCDLVRVELGDGEVLDAQLIETYDHRLWWWDVADRTTLALFVPSDYAAYPDDASFRFVALSDVASMEDGEQAAECYLEFVERRAFTIDRSPLEGASQILMGNSGYHRYEGGMGDFAWDFTLVDDTGARFEGDGTQNTDYLVWDEPVVAPVSGYVVDVVDDAADNPPGDYPEGATNNLVGIHLGGSFYLYVLHLKQGSIPDDIAVDTRVDAGDRLGTVGNSGVSLEPHLHVTMLWYDADADRSWSVPTRFQSLEVAPTPKGPWRERDFYRPVTGDNVRD